MKLEVFFASDGDCLLLTSGDGHRALIDGGRSGTFREETWPALQALAKAGERHRPRGREPHRRRPHLRDPLAHEGRGGVDRPRLPDHRRGQPRLPRAAHPRDRRGSSALAQLVAGAAEGARGPDRGLRRPGGRRPRDILLRPSEGVGRRGRGDRRDAGPGREHSRRPRPAAHRRRRDAVPATRRSTGSRDAEESTARRAARQDAPHGDRPDQEAPRDAAQGVAQVARHARGGVPPGGGSLAAWLSGSLDRRGEDHSSPDEHPASSRSRRRTGHRSRCSPRRASAPACSPGDAAEEEILEGLEAAGRIAAAASGATS